MSSDNTIPGLIKTYFWMVHYDFSPVVETRTSDGLTPIPAGKRKGVVVIIADLYRRHKVDFKMPRETEGDPDPANFRGSSLLRNRIIGFYATPEAANAHMTEKLWGELQEKAGAVYAELHSMRLEVAEEQPDVLKLVA